ncbi:MAG: hypothetical protein COT92_00975 [Candidatus Doudnabacteria bacterium CG10_big_fil_rev_8_21_14_0_10_42_18]|uniref:Type II toxin-antitoxin system Phd/YefM family antitoxin n=1 Tax=Candidatus Doudnabacteria bacterium CG10_big_fil_rev_8_21_14_0_10_42_18 TaxID=1974552 RepID=A0A2H0VBH5_9BACT|nr:MAG: hypothetical protein COT92_00975 [Candidatus Doudnabacteria bacterium CG10_big_fil_rev_8_21_14_0_10_42_18]
MATLKDLIDLAKVDGGKFFVMDENGDAKLVIMGVEEYQKMLLGKLKKQIMDVEKINQEILKAQLGDEDLSVTNTPVKEEVIYEPIVPKIDLREEVIDPSFDFEGPKIDFDDI